MAKTARAAFTAMTCAAGLIGAALFVSAVINFVAKARELPFVGPRLPAFVAFNANGTPVDSTGLCGRIVIVNVWATWCAPCRLEVPDLLELKKQLGERIEIVGLSIDSYDSEGRSRVRAFAQALSITFPILVAHEKLQSALPPTPVVPTTFVVDRSCRLVSKITGRVTVSRLRSEVERLSGPEWASAGIK